MSYFSPGALRDHWFKIGRLEVGTTMLVVLAVVGSWLTWVGVAAGGGDLVGALLLVPSAVLQGEVWRLVSWPLANALGLWPVLGLYFFWYFGTDLEERLGKSRMASLLLGIWASLTVVTMLLGFVLPFGAGVLAGIGEIQFIVLLLWIAEYPRRPFFFGIPAWAVGAVLVALNVLTYIASGNLGAVLSMLLSFVVVAVVARRLGMLNDFDWIPGRPGTPRAGAVGNKPTRAAKEQAKRQQQRAQDRAKLDALLDQINDKGMDSLTPAQRRELMKLRNRR